MEKQELRNMFIARLSALSETERQLEDVAICKHLLALPEWQNAESIFCYAPYAWEINTFPLMEAALHKGKRLAVPRIGMRGEMAAKQISSLSELCRERYGIYAPAADAPTFEPGEIDLIIVPGVVFEIKGLLRMGRGGGYYDRYIAASSATALGLARECQLAEDKIVMLQHDQPLDILVTRHGVHRQAK